jgi:hypothetical protein
LPFCADGGAQETAAVSVIGTATTTDNVVTPGNCTHNGFINAAATRYQGDYPTTQPGANDVLMTGTPAFVDVTRTSLRGPYLGAVQDRPMQIV